MRDVNARRVVERVLICTRECGWEEEYRVMVKDTTGLMHEVSAMVTDTAPHSIEWPDDVVISPGPTHREQLLVLEYCFTKQVNAPNGTSSPITA